MIRKVLSSKKVPEVYTSWVKVVFAIVAGFVLGYLLLGFLGDLTFITVFNFIVLILLTCVLALLLDIRKLLLA
jgi:hypothetical protein